jgi:hypothetical protein
MLTESRHLLHYLLPRISTSDCPDRMPALVYDAEQDLVILAEGQRESRGGGKGSMSLVGHGMKSAKSGLYIAAHKIG